MTARWGLWGGLVVFLVLLALPAPGGMPLAAWRTCAIVLLMATWWMTQALPLTATALLPFILFPLFGIVHQALTDVAERRRSPTWQITIALIAATIGVRSSHGRRGGGSGGASPVGRRVLRVLDTRIFGVAAHAL